MTNYVVKDEWNNCYLYFSRFVRDMDIISVAERRANPKNATVFSNKEDAQACINELNNYHTYETGGCVIKDLADIDAEATKKAKELSDEVLKNAWKNSSEETKKKLLEQMSEEKRKQWLETVEANAN